MTTIRLIGSSLVPLGTKQLNARHGQMNPEQRAEELGIQIPDLREKGYSGAGYGPIKPHHQVGNVLYLSGHLPEYPDGTVLHPGRLGADLTVDQGYEAARLAAINVLAGIRYALGDLTRVASIIQSLNYVVCTPDFHETNVVANGLSDLLRAVLGDEAGIGGRATAGITSLIRNHCFEAIVTVEVRT
jgi:enamine deaminase RidA (YjgF/YER057c/UK114 family)